MIPERSSHQSLRSGLDRLAHTGERHMRGCGVPTDRRTRAAAIGLYDRQLHLHDRLVTADEFIQRPRAEGFISAAVEDANGYLARAEQAELERIEIAKAARDQRMKWVYGAAVALLLLVAALWLLNRERTPQPDDARLASLGPTANTQVGSMDADAPGRDGAKRPDRKAMEQMARTRSSGDPTKVSPDRAEATPSQASMSKAGQAAAAKPSNASSSSSGTPSDKASPNEGQSNEQKSSEQSSRSSSDTPGAESQPMTERQQQSSNMSGADADKESSSNQEQAAGANSTNQQSQARSESSQSDSEKKEGQKGSAGAPGQQQASQKSNQGAAQGASANPGASNNQSQGKGQGSSKDALKKSRGVASMILGVPIPDRVRGLPNPGLVRTVQKKTVPKEEQVASVEAESRGERTRAMGHIEHPELTPWMKDLVRDYFSQESSNEGKP